MTVISPDPRGQFFDLPGHQMIDGYGNSRASEARDNVRGFFNRFGTVAL